MYTRETIRTPGWLYPVTEIYFIKASSALTGVYRGCYTDTKMNDEIILENGAKMEQFVIWDTFMLKCHFSHCAIISITVLEDNRKQ